MLEVAMAQLLKVSYMNLEGAGSGTLAAMRPFPTRPIPCVGSHFVLQYLFCKH